MLKKFYPDNIIESVYDYDFVSLYNKGYRLLIFDIDNTLVKHNAPADDRAIKLFKELKDIGFKTCLISNNKKDRVLSFFNRVNADNYIFKAGKPKKSGYLEAMKSLGENNCTTVFFGDQLFTDVYGAKRLGILSIVVKPIDKKEEIQIVLKRRLEKIIYYFYRKQEEKINGQD